MSPDPKHVAFLKAGFGFEGVPALHGRRATLRPPAMTDYVAWAELRTLSREHLTKWEPQWANDELTRSAYRRRLRHYQRESREDLGYAFVVIEQDSDRLIGGVTLSNVRRGVSQSASLGYWVGLTHVGRGFMTEAVQTVSIFAFGTLRLHRLEAACMPSNHASIRVLHRNGFSQEGLAPSYLKINGEWQDHLLFGLVAPGNGSVGAAAQ